jgi:carbon monoxide dehydrogenase subunit G
MFKISESVDIDKPIDQVFAYVSDPRNRHNWQPGLHEVRVDGGKHREVRKLMGRTVEHDVELTDHVPNAHVTYRATGRGHESTLTTRINFTDIGGSTRVALDLEVDTEGMLTSGEPVIQRIIQREIRSNLEHLKDILEAPADVHAVMEATFPKHPGLSG